MQLEPKNKKLFDPNLMGSMNQVGLNHQVVVEEFCPINVVGMDSPHFGRGDKNMGGFLAGHHRLNIRLTSQVEFGTGEGDGLGQSGRVQGPDEGTSHHAPVAGNVDFGLCVHGLQS